MRARGSRRSVAQSCLRSANWPSSSERNLSPASPSFFLQATSTSHWNSRPSHCRISWHFWPAAGTASPLIRQPETLIERAVAAVLAPPVERDNPTLLSMIYRGTPRRSGMTRECTFYACRSQGLGGTQLIGSGAPSLFATATYVKMEVLSKPRRLRLAPWATLAGQTGWPGKSGRLPACVQGNSARRKDGWAS
jgi:hypothetical protein